MKRDDREFKQASPSMLASPIQKKELNDYEGVWFGRGEWSDL